MEQINTGDKVILDNFAHHNVHGENWATASGLSIGEVRTVLEVQNDWLRVGTPALGQLYIRRENFIKTLNSRFEEGEILSLRDMYLQRGLSAIRNTEEEGTVAVPWSQERVATNIPVDPSIGGVRAAPSKYKVASKMEGYGIKYS